MFDKSGWKSFACRKGSGNQIEFRRLNESILVRVDAVTAVISKKDADSQSVSSDEDHRVMNMHDSGDRSKKESPERLSDAELESS